MKVRVRLLSVVVAAAAAVAPGLVWPAASQASTIGNIYISFPTWLANCSQGGHVTAIWATDGPQTWNGDRGDDLIYGKVYLNQWNSIQYSVFCSNGWASYYQPGYSSSFYPTRNGQTVWVGPAGWTRN